MFWWIFCEASERALLDKLPELFIQLQDDIKFQSEKDLFIISFFCAVEEFQEIKFEVAIAIGFIVEL